MKEKKEMQIVITADDSKAKTSLQRLADLFDNKFKDGKSTKLDIDTSEARARLVQVNNDIKWLKSEIKDIQPGTPKFGLWAKELERAETEASKLRDVLKETNVETKKVEVDMSKDLEKASKKSRKFVLSLFSIRSAWALISRASRTYLSENEDTSNKVSGLWSYFGNVFGAIIERVVNWLQYGIAYINVFLKALTGIDFLAKSIQKTTAKTNKELKKTVSSMDEIVNLDIDEGTGADVGTGLQGINDLELNPKIVKAMETLGNALKTVWEWAKKAWGFLEEHFGTSGAMEIVGGLALMLGAYKLGGGGVLGLVFAFSTLATIQLTSLIKQVKELNEAQDEQLKAEEKAVGAKVALYNYYRQQYENAKTEEERSDYLEKMKKAYDDMANTIETTNADLSKTVELAEGWNGYYDKTKSLAEQIDDATKSAKKTFDSIDSEKKIKFKLDADTTLAESKTGNWFNRLWSQLKFSVSSLWDSIKFAFSGKYATGGFPETGQMFIANEKGPELVGNIGSSTAVVNNQQIVDSVSIGVANAVAGVLGSQKSSSNNATYLYLNGKEFAKAVYNDMETESQRRNKNTSIRRS